MRGLAGVMASLLVMTAVATSYTNTRSAFINARLGTFSMKLVETGDTDADTYHFKSEFSSLSELVEAKRELATQISAEGTVLLKNENDALPMNPATESVTLWGHNTLFPARGGMIGSSASAADGQETADIPGALASRGFQLNQDMLGLYGSEAAFAYTRTTFFPGAGLIPSFEPTWDAPAVYMVGEIPASMYTDELLASADGTAAVVVITRDSSEAADYEPTMFNGTEGDTFERPLALSQYERDMIALAKAHSTKVIVLINADNPMEIEELKTDSEIDAILWVGEPGIYGFYGVADILAGNANPSGHLPDTWAVNSTSAPAMRNFGLYLYTNNSQNGAGNLLTTDNKADWYVVETEGIYQGYKYYETRYEDAVLGRGNADASDGSSTGGGWNYADEVSYPFGYGGSYTTFSQTLDSIDVRIGETGSASVTVENTGDAAGKSVVQLYVQTPYAPGGLEKAAIQLIGFAKTAELAPGESETVTVEIDPSLFASYDETAVKMDGTEGAWALESGDYWFAVGNGAHEALNNVLAAKLSADTVESETGNPEPPENQENPEDTLPATPAIPENLVTVTADETVNAANAALWTLDAADMETYSDNVQNALQNADINKLIPDTAEYVTRADWTKGWKTVESITPTDEMMVGLTNSNYILSANGDGVTWGADNGLTFVAMTLTDDEGRVVGAVDFDDPLWNQLVEQITLDEAIHFIEWAGDDIENIDSVLLPRTYMNDGPLGFAFDQVAGYKTRWTSNDAANPYYVSSQPEAGYSMTSMPTEPVVAATFNAELAEREGQLIGEDALYSRESILIGPGMNLHRTPYCARNHEYYSEDSVLTNLLGKRFCAGTASKGLVAQVKHLAFNHQELNRAGISTFFTEQAARENELRCFQGAMSENLTGTVMTAFNRAGTVFVGAHSGVLEQIARNEWGFLGGYVTDMVNGAMYMNWLDTVAGGGGTMLGSSANWTGTTLGTMEAAKNAIAKDTFFQEQMQYTLKTWLYTLAQSNAVNGLSTTTKMVTVYPWWLMAQFVADGVFAVLALLFVVLALRSRRKDEEIAKKGPGIVFAVLSALAGIVAAVLYKGSYNTTIGSWVCLIAAVVVAALSLIGSRGNAKIWNWGASVAAVLTAAGIALSVTVMADPIGYVISGLYPPETLTGYITFGVAACAAWLLCLITGFTGVAKEN